MVSYQVGAILETKTGSVSMKTLKRTILKMQTKQLVDELVNAGRYITRSHRLRRHKTL